MYSNRKIFITVVRTNQICTQKKNYFIQIDLKFLLKVVEYRILLLPTY